MAYEVIVDNESKKLEIHYDLCDDLLEKKDNFEFNSKVEYINLIDFESVEEFINKEDYKEYEKIFCDICKPIENKEKYDEEFDDFYEEFDEDEEYGADACNIY